MRGVNCPSRQRRSTRFAWPEPRIPATHTSVSTTIFTDTMIAYMQSIGNEKISGVVCPFCAPVRWFLVGLGGVLPLKSLLFS